jgi:hypothetical protein
VQSGPNCAANPTPAEKTIQDCVCQKDSLCCSKTWDNICVDEVGLFGCGTACVGVKLPACDAPATAGSKGSCFQKGSSTCNPVTNDSCAADEACDLNVQTGFFECFPPDNTVIQCGACDVNGPFCTGTLHCFNQQCARFCCTDADCGASGTCDTALSQDGVGLCIAK